MCAGNARLPCAACRISRKGVELQGGMRRILQV